MTIQIDDTTYPSFEAVMLAYANGQISKSVFKKAKNYVDAFNLHRRQSLEEDLESAWDDPTDTSGGPT